MSDVPKFTLAFLEKRPFEAARVLEQLPPERASALFQELSPAVGGKVLKKLLPDYSALCLKSISPSLAATLIQEIPTFTAATILRFMPDASVTAILESLPDKKRAPLTKQLAYPQNTVGAWMNSQTMGIPENLTVGEARKFIRQSGGRMDYQVYVVNNDRTLEGMIELAALAITKDSLPISKLLIKDIIPLSDRASLDRLKSLPAWERFEALPVINKKGRFLGVLTQSSIDKAFSTNDSSNNSLDLSSVLMDLTKTYVSTLSLLVEGIMSLSFFNKPPKKSKHGI